MPVLADQVTAVLVAPLTEAVNCCVPPEATLAEVGEMVTATSGGGAAVGKTVCVAVELEPALSVMVRVTVNVPAAL